MREWWHRAGVRALKTVAQAAVAMIGTSVVLQDVDWRLTISAAILAGILSLLTSIAGLPELGNTDTDTVTDIDSDSEKSEDENL